MNVEVIQWPREQDRREALEKAGQPRLLVVAPESAAPTTADPLEDWIRLPAPESDISARLNSLEVAEQQRQAFPLIDEDGLLRFRDAWVAIPAIEARIARSLLDRFGTVVSREDLLRAGWGSSPTRRNSLDVQMLRLRRRVVEVGLEIKTVRSRGYLLEFA